MANHEARFTILLFENFFLAFMYRLRQGFKALSQYDIESIVIVSDGFLNKCGISGRTVPAHMVVQSCLLSEAWEKPTIADNSVDR